MKVALLYNQKPDMPLKVAVGGSKYASDEFAEWDNPETIEAIAAALGQRHTIVKVDCDPKRLPEIIATLIKEKPDICFNIAEGSGHLSREAQMPAICEMLGLRYTASDVLTLATTLDKARTKEILHYHQILTPAFEVVHDEAELQDLLHVRWTEWKFASHSTLIVKPLHEGSSKGIFERSVVKSHSELGNQVREVLTTYKQPAIIEAFLEGREFTVAMIGNGNNVQVLPIVELLFEHLPKDSNKIYSYEAKWLWDEPNNPVEVFHCPANISDELRYEIEDLCRKAYAAMRCRDWARIDVRIDNVGRPNIIEVNPLPGILPNPNEHSCFPMAARKAGLDYNALINRVLDEACKRYGLI
jgi:D-alanine-D-alanine ligase